MSEVILKQGTWSITLGAGIRHTGIAPDGAVDFEWEVTLHHAADARPGEVTAAYADVEVDVKGVVTVWDTEGDRVGVVLPPLPEGIADDTWPGEEARDVVVALNPVEWAQIENWFE